jgi:hypothetical protein
LPAATHSRLALTCLTYLQTGCVDDVITDEEDDQDYGIDFASMAYGKAHHMQDQAQHEGQRTRLQYPFFAYASANWDRHVMKASIIGVDTIKLTVAIGQFLSKEQHMWAWLKIQ